MPNLAQIKLPSPIRLAISSISGKPALMVLSVLILAPLAAHAQGSPFDTGFNAIQSLFTGTIAKVASLVAIVRSPWPRRATLVTTPHSASCIRISLANKRASCLANATSR